ncbi:MAG: VCBS repeat-containing protein [Acidobacteriaceae bacterium]|nr:VCBS repeat-containing protein [Acidobacteriaceae bacterium]
MGDSTGSLSRAVGFSKFVSAATECIHPSKLLPFSKPHSAAFVDLNGDCKADLFFTSTDGSNKMHELWVFDTRTSDGNATYCLNYYQSVDSDSSQVSFTDYNRDGRIDMIYAVKNKIYFKKNLLSLPVVDGDDCAASSRTQTIFAPAENYSDSLALSADFTDLYSSSLYPATIRVGDFNVDGFPDLLITVKRKSDNAKTYLCESNEASFSFDGACTLVSDNAVLAAFFDFDEDGKVDILVVTPNGDKNTLNTYYQYYNRDSFFLKVMQLQKEDYGSVFYGAQFSYTYTDLEGSRHIGVGFQAPQNSHSALQLPYGIVGIGRSSNYIEHLYVSYPVSVSPNYHVWSPIIPNSQIIIKSYMKNGNK